MLVEECLLAEVAHTQFPVVVINRRRWFQQVDKVLQRNIKLI